MTRVGADLAGDMDSDPADMSRDDVGKEDVDDDEDDDLDGERFWKDGEDDGRDFGDGQVLEIVTDGENDDRQKRGISREPLQYWWLCINF